MKKLCYTLFLVIFLFVNGYSASDVVLVTAERVKGEKSAFTQNIITLDEEEIKSYGTEYVADLLKQLNIGHIHNYPGLSTSVAIRGFRSDTHGIDLRGHILILVDGRRAGTGNLAKLLTKNVERIEIIRGPAGIQYGSAAMGGVINIITKRGSKNKNIFIEQGIGSFGYLESTLGGSGKLGVLDYSFSGTEVKRDNYATTHGEYENTDYGVNNISINFGYNLKRHRFGVIYKIYNGYDIGLTSQYNFTSNYKDDEAEKMLKSIDLDYEGVYELGQLKLKYYKGVDENIYYDKLKNDYWGSPEKSKYKTNFEGAQCTFSMENNILKIVTGVDYNKYENENRNSDSVAPYSPDSLYKNYGLFLIPKFFFINNRLVIVGGIRYDKFKLKINDTPLRDDVTESSEDFSNVIYSAGVAYNKNKHFKFRVNYGEAYIIPQADQMNADYSVWGTPYKGNPDLNPEKSRTYEAGFDYNNKGLSFSYTHFYTKYKDKIVVEYTGAYKTWINKGKATFRGSEINFKWDIGELLEWPFILEPYFNVTYFDKFRDEDNDEKLLYVSRLQANYGLYFSHYDLGTSIRLNFAYTGEQDIEYYDPATLFSERMKLGSFTVATLNVEQKIYENKFYGKLLGTAVVDNLFNENYEYVKGYPMPERNYKVTLKYIYEF
ncbi:TonB-dependent receptor [Deferribacter autotrophicus]|uniref:TonB-dependent receptor n=1 Tax=Deferribacter autotrophicus TaxID=500465 RepID=A0A5A8F0V8_9BACT|nr:TonB-dependent receptor [Deferribacter autotrophicus]KAA0257031.1 TonB-dependent receptor [Deferribacter autotrophicus]